MYTSTEIDTTSRAKVRDAGEVFTPFKIVEEMLALIPKTAWKDPSYCFLEPTSGNGQFLVKVLEKRLKSGVPLEVALNTLIGMEINPETLVISHKRLYDVAVKQMEADGLKRGSKAWFERAMRVVAIVKNNIFKVKDSLEYMAGPIKSKKFFFDDPTGNAQVLSPSAKEREWDKIKKAFRAHKDGNLTKTLSPFFGK